MCGEDCVREDQGWREEEHGVLADEDGLVPLEDEVHDLPRGKVSGDAPREPGGLGSRTQTASIFVGWALLIRNVRRRWFGF